MARITGLHPELRPGDVWVGDRAFGTFAHLALLVSHGLHGVFRMGPRRGVDFTPNRPPPPRWNTAKLTGKARSRWVRALGPEDQVVEWDQPYQRPAWMSAEDSEGWPLTLTVRPVSLPGRPAGLPSPGGDAGDHAAGCGSLPTRGVG